jgi:hypothetical protein
MAKEMFNPEKIQQQFVNSIYQIAGFKFYDDTVQ